MHSKRGQINEPRNVAIYLARKRSGFTLEEFGLKKYSSVSSIVCRTETQLSRNKTLQKRVEEIWWKIGKSQAKIRPYLSYFPFMIAKPLIRFLCVKIHSSIFSLYLDIKKVPV